MYNLHLMFFYDYGISVYTVSHKHANNSKAYKAGRGLSE